MSAYIHPSCNMAAIPNWQYEMLKERTDMFQSFTQYECRAIATYFEDMREANAADFAETVRIINERIGK